ncbi:hypothetical protein EYF80_040099 [Liparis tanakae]|uniref:Uncharacterized protein n=1 Tax=Liparis tanakae TaxID=230148 RepID=A0A4Z2GA73_9TELE|nr:hypothetical protein EYF80_040099 [Liparis tanakae]
MHGSVGRHEADERRMLWRQWRQKKKKKKKQLDVASVDYFALSSYQRFVPESQGPLTGQLFSSEAGGQEAREWGTGREGGAQKKSTKIKSGAFLDPETPAAESHPNMSPVFTLIFECHGEWEEYDPSICGRKMCTHLESYVWICVPPPTTTTTTTTTPPP